MEQISFAAAIVLWGVLPGLAVAAAAGAGGTLVERLAAAPGLSLAIVAFSAYATEIARLPIAPTPVGAITIAICAGLALLARALPAQGPGRIDAGRAWPTPSPSWIPWLVLLTPIVIAQQIGSVANEVLLPPTLHDGLDHANWFRLIYETQSLNPYEVLAPPMRDGVPNYYPWGMHAWLALVAQTTALDPVAVLMQGLSLISAALPLSVYAFVSLFTGRGWTAIAAAMFSLLFWWLPYQVWAWGGYPLLTGAIAALPLGRLALEAVDRWHVPPVLAALVCGLGALAIHPSQAMAAVIVCLVAAATLAASGLTSWRTPVPFAAALAAPALLFTAGASLWPPVETFVDQARRVTTAPTSPYPVWLRDLYTPISLPDEIWPVLAALSLAGAALSWWIKAARPFVVLHVAVTLLIALARPETWLTTLWYHSPERLWYAQYASLPALAAVGLTGIVLGLERLFARLSRVRPMLWLIWPLALWALATQVYPSFETVAKRRLFRFAHANPTGTIADRRILADFAWMRTNIPAGEVLFNAPADWGLPLPFTGLRTVFWSGGHAMDPVPRWFRLLDRIRSGDPDASLAAAELPALGIHYVYAASLGDALEAGRQRFNREELEGVAMLERIHDSPTAAVFRIRDDGATRLGVHDDERIHFAGFHPPETSGGRAWRWSIGDGRISVRTDGLPAGGCVVRIHGPQSGEYSLWIGDDALELTAYGHVIPERHRQAGTVELVLHVPEQSRRVEGTGPRARPVGVRVMNVEIRCGT